MRHLRVAEHALRLASDPARQQYVCRTCIAQAARQIHTSPSRRAEIPFLKRLRNSVFGSKEPKQTEEAAKAAQSRRAEEDAKNLEARGPRRKIVKGKTYEVAAVIDPSKHKEYVLASTWNGLHRVGGAEWVKAQNDRGEQYVGFLQKDVATLSDDQWQRVLHHVAVEVLTLHKAGRDVLEACGQHSLGTETNTADVQVSASGDLVYPSSETERNILDASSPSDQTPPGTELAAILGQISSLEHPIDATSRYPTWVNIKLEDPKLKFAIFKRTMQLTGHRIPDFALSNSTTILDLFTALKAKPKPKKLADTTQLQKLKSSELFPNVAVYESRRTPVHKEKEVGRWKLIEDELARRDLPVFGSRHQDAKERLQPLGNA